MLVKRSMLLMLCLAAIAAALLPLPGAPTLAQSATAGTTIVNGGFENGRRPWVQYSSAGRQLITRARPYAGAYSAHLGGYTGGTDMIYQTITVPADATLTYFWYMSTEELATSAHDYLHVRLYSTSGRRIATLHTVTNRSPQGVWRQKSVSLASYAGQTLRVAFRAANDDTLATTFFVDNVAIRTSGGSLDAEEAEFLRLINNYRQARSRPPLTLNAKLTAAAAWLSQDMADKNYFSHKDSLGREFWERLADFGYTASAMGENIAAANQTAQATFEQWKASPDHNTNMLNSSYREIGIGRAYNASSTYDWYWTTDFGG